jgi:uncharacterized protein (DUF1501 family)
MKMNRRDFIKTSAIATAALGMGTLLPSRSAAVTPLYPILIVVNLEGGNDGVNTVIPLNATDYNRYRDLRPTLGYNQNVLTTLAGNSNIALNPGMGAFGQLWSSNKLAVITGVSVPTLSADQFDHDAQQYEFQSCDVLRDQLSVPTGWLGRYLDTHMPAPGDPTKVTPGIDLGGGRLMLTGNTHVPVSISTISDFNLRIYGTPSTAKRTAYTNIMNAYIPENTVDAANRDFRKQALAQSALITSATASFPPFHPTWNPPSPTDPTRFFPDNWFGRQMWEATKLALASGGANGIGVRAMAIGIGGFDTHSGQDSIITTDDFGVVGETIPYHQYLLKSVANGIKASYDYLAGQSASSNVVFLTISEFGRRVEENAGLGTDHGFASMAFAVGDLVNKGVYGTYQSLTSLYAGYSPDDGSLKFGADFRDFYSSVLAAPSFYNVDPQPILDPDNNFPNFNPMGFI